MCLSFPVRILNLQLVAEQRSIAKCWNPPKNMIISEITSQEAEVMVQKEKSLLPDGKGLSPTTHLPQHANITSSLLLHLN